MQTIPLNELVRLDLHHANDAAFIIIRDKSTFIRVSAPNDFTGQDALWAFPTPLCGDGAEQYHPGFVMAILSATPMQTFDQIQIPKVLFTTDNNIRRSMTVNAMRMSTELFDGGSERVFQLARQRLEAGQTDVVHDLLVYLMHAILDARRDFAREKNLRAESIAAFLGLAPAKVLLLLDRCEDAAQLASNLRRGQAGPLQRELDVAAVVSNQMDLLFPYQQRAAEKEALVKTVIGSVLQLWRDC